MQLALLLLFVCCAPINKTAMEKEILRIDVPQSVHLPPDISEQEDSINQGIVERALQRLRIIYEEEPGNHYEFYPAFMFPFSFLKDTIPMPKNPKNLYLIKSNIVVTEYKENKELHLQVAVLHYTKSNLDPWARIYTLHFLCLDTLARWREERLPISVVMIISKDRTYKLGPP